MAFNNTEHSLVVVDSVLRSKRDNDSGGRLSIDSALLLRKRKNIFGVCEKLKGCWELAIINYV